MSEVILTPAQAATMPLADNVAPPPKIETVATAHGERSKRRVDQIKDAMKLVDKSFDGSPAPSGNKEPQPTAEVKAETTSAPKVAEPEGVTKQPVKEAKQDGSKDKESSAEDSGQEKGKAKAWEGVLAREKAQQKEREKLKAEREAFKKEQDEHNRNVSLAKSDPVEFAQKFGGPDFAKRWVEKASGKENYDDKVEAAIAPLKEEITVLQAERMNGYLQNYIDSNVNHWKSDAEQGPLLRGWYADEEIPLVVQDSAHRHLQQTGDMLTPSDLSGRISHELRFRLERFSKTDAGRKYLQALIGDVAPEAKPRTQQAPPVAASAPKTLSNDLNAQGNTPGNKAKTHKDRILAGLQAMRSNS
jgi:hypothetical protein